MISTSHRVNHPSFELQNVGEECERDVVASRDVYKRRANDATQIKPSIHLHSHRSAGGAELEARAAVEAASAKAALARDHLESRLRRKAFCVGSDRHYVLLREVVQRIAVVVPKAWIIRLGLCPANDGSIHRPIHHRPQTYRLNCICESD